MDPKFDAAWKTFQQKTKSDPPHVAAAELRQFMDEELLERLLKRHAEESTKIFTLKEPPAVGRENAERWYSGPQQGDVNWPALRKRLEQKLDPVSVQKIDEASDKVVAMLDHPGTPTFASRGLVVGHVQSGKTSNFTAVAAKAADRGYRLIIVLSGIHNALRRQTQARMIKDVVELNSTKWIQVTELDHDFVPLPNPAGILSTEDKSLLLVVKKNGPVLKKLCKWLEAAPDAARHCPALIIDDEADQATVATKTINPLIQKVLKALPRHCYVGYTATPFANLLIDPASEDFYPKDFILSLPRGEAYQGPETLFGREPLDGEDPAGIPGGLDMLRSVPEQELEELRPAKAADIPGFQPEMTASLRAATHWFWLATAARRVRTGKAEHSSMLVHAHSNTQVHDSFAPLFRAYRTRVMAALAQGDPALLSELRGQWTEEARRVGAVQMGEEPVSFPELEPLLQAVVGDTQIILDHYRSPNRLDYDSGPATVIAIGGNTLSRGLTLEGLVVSFFVRSADVYDTLLQMGRWFGYRIGYSDLPRIWMTDRMRAWFTHLATVEADMRREIDRYIIEHQSPLQLAVRIRCHPQMRVTAPSKSKDAVKVAASYGASLIESRYFPTLESDADWHARNAEACHRLVALASSEGLRKEVADGRILYTGVGAEAVLGFMDEYAFHERSVEASPSLMGAYVRKRLERGGLLQWNVAIMGLPPDDRRPAKLPTGDLVGSVVRSRINANLGMPVADIKTLTGSRDSAIDLKVPPGMSLTRTAMQSLRSQQQPEHGLVLLYPIDGKAEAVRPDRHALAAPVDITWGAAFVFPKPSQGVDVEVDYNYIAADLTKVFPDAIAEDEVDVAVLEEDMEGDVAVAAEGQVQV